MHLHYTSKFHRNRTIKTTTSGADGMKNLTPTLVAATLLTCVTLTCATFAHAQTASLAGSRASMERQHQHAVSAGYTFSRTSAQVRDLVDQGDLVRVRPSRHLTIHNVSFPYLNTSVKTLLERLSSQYYNACGEKLVATSMTRPINRQPANAAHDSVHPTGMAFDLRIPAKQSCRSWLERTLLSLEEREVLDVTRERNPPHYHVAVFPQPYRVYLATITGQDSEYIVRRGDTLSAIASRTNVSVPQIRAANGLRGDLINIGQKLTIPGAGSGSAATVATAGSADQSVPVLREVTHRVQPGETLWRIASRYRTSVDTLRDHNGLAGDLLRVGQLLRVVMDDS